MNKIKTITVITILVIALVVTGCSGPSVKNTESHMEPHTCVEEVARGPWYQAGNIDINWIP